MVNIMKRIRNVFFVLLVFATISGDFILECKAQTRLKNGLNIVGNQVKDAFLLVHFRQAADIYADPCDAKVVHIAADAFRKDVEKVTGM